MSKSAQKNTIFNYFVKSPTSSDSSKPSTPLRAALTPSNAATPKLKVKHGSSVKTPKPSSSDSFSEADLVWAKLDGYPYWPGLVCRHPTRETVQEKDKIHIQFFDDPPTRSWISKSFVKPFTGRKSFTQFGTTKPKDKSWEKGCDAAEEAQGLSTEDRLKLVTCLAPSDDEEENASLHSEKSTPKFGRDKKSRAPQPKRRRILSNQSDEYQPDEDVSMEDAEESPEEEEESLIEEEEPSPEPRKRKPASAKSLTATFESPSVALKTKNKLLDFSCVDGGLPVSSQNAEARNFTHLALDWLKPENIKDGKGRRPDNIDYDPHTLYVPEKFKQGLTPAMKQWWDMKSKHYDVILFFKMGKFYELYHMDALLAVKELGIILMKGDHAHCGFPERGFAKHSSILIERGYKVARVEQTETPEMCNDRVKKTPKATKFDKVVQRELCQITSIGTRTYNVMEGDSWQVENNFLMAIWEKCGTESRSVEFGVAFVDTSVGHFHLGQFHDDRYRSRLSTLLTRFHPVEMISARRSISAETLQIFSTACPSVLQETLSPNADCWDTGKTLRSLAEKDYFKIDNELEWPQELKNLLDGSGSSLNLVPAEEAELAVKALGALYWYLKECQLDQELLSRRSFQIYKPLDTTEESGIQELTGTHLVLDGMTLRNLDVLANSSTGTLHGSLLDRLNRCSTPFGQRMLRHWICAPLCQPELIEDRLDAVSFLSSNPNLLEEVGKMLKSLPDLERLVNKIHGQGSSLRARNHPDGRAIFFDGPLYSKKKITDFMATLEGFKKASKVLKIFENECDDLSSSLLKRCVKRKEDGGEFPEMKEELDFFEKAFDHQEAAKEGKMIPRPGVDPEYDDALKRISSVQAEAEQYLMEQKTHFGCKVVYVGTEKKRFQLEVAESAAKKAGAKYELQGQRKGFKRYWTDETRDLVHRLMAAEELRDTALKDIARRIFEQFDQRHLMWEKAIECLSNLDVLSALAAYANDPDHQMCRPKLIRPSADQPPFMKMIQGRHPAHSQLFVSNDFIPNDVSIGLDSQHSLTLVTGPNMGGKSTLMRQVGLCVILAQMGSFVPCEEFELTPVDRLFTRLGANDHILGGESTFFVELSETAAILKHSTIHSLVLLDELGRGTSTFDGTAIAYSVVDYLAERRCRTLFSTHYHSLVKDLMDRPQVKLGHMACMAEEDEKVEDPSQESIIFLYQFVDGACPKSYGFHAARLAGLHKSIISRGYERARDMEMEMGQRQAFKDLFNQGLNVDWKSIGI